MINSLAGLHLHRLNLEVMVEVAGSSSTRRKEPSLITGAQSQEEATTNGTTEKQTKFRAVVKTEDARITIVSREEDDLFGAQLEAAIQESESQNSQKNKADVDDGDDVVLGAEARRRTDSGSSLTFMICQETSEVPPSLYRDIWTLRASLEQYASSDQCSTDRESIRSDADSVSSLSGAGARSGLDSCLSQDLDDEPEGEGEGEMLEGGIRGAPSGDSAAGGEGEAGNRKLLQMDSGYASIEAPSRAPEELRLFGIPGAPRGKTATERRLFFTSSGRKGSVCESVETKLFEEELEDDVADNTETEAKAEKGAQNCGEFASLQEPFSLLKSVHQKPPESQSTLTKPSPQPSAPHGPRLRRRDYSIDEKTDALFNEFLRHDPRFDQQDSPLRSRHRSRVHLRKQWQRHKQYSDPGSSTGGRYSPSLERQRFMPLRRGDSAGYPLDTRYHSTLSRIASAADEEASEVAAYEEATKKNVEDNDPSNEGATGTTTESSASKASEGTDATASSYSCSGSAGEGGGCQVSANKTSPSLTTVTPQKSIMDPRTDNRNNNSSQAILSEVSLQAESSLADKLALSVEERLYGSLHRAELGQDGSECALTVSRTASPGFSPV